MVALQKAFRPPAPLGPMRVCSPRPPAPALAILHLSSAVKSCSYDSTVPPGIMQHGPRCSFMSICTSQSW